MKHTVITAALLCALACPAFAADGQKADPNDPCAIVLCLAGKLDGSSPTECDPMYKTFMSVKKKNKHGFLPGHTVVRGGARLAGGSERPGRPALLYGQNMVT